MIFALLVLSYPFLSTPFDIGGGLRKRLTRSPSPTSGARSPTKMENSFSGGRSCERNAGLTASGLEEEVEEAAQLALKGREEDGM
jgi:hypothetical protein